jgi:hypothetical protein
MKTHLRPGERSVRLRAKRFGETAPKPEGRRRGLKEATGPEGRSSSREEREE